VVARQSAWESAQIQLAEAVKHLGLDDGTHQLLATPRREMTVSIPLRRDDGHVEVLRGYRVQHNLSRGHELVFFERIDNTQAGSIAVSQDKARTAARFKRPTKAFEDALAGGRQAILGLPGVTPLEGGLPLVIEGKIVGAIGVSGATSPQDGVCAQAAADTLGKQPAMPAPAAPATPPAPKPPVKK